jgi:diguanylate cyclase (GGDEF)-like protein
MICVRDFDFVARYGDEEFLIILKDTEHNITSKIAERIQTTIEKTIIKSIHASITISGGVSTSQVKNINNLIKLADENLYKTKKMVEIK